MATSADAGSGTEESDPIETTLGKPDAVGNVTGVMTPCELMSNSRRNPSFTLLVRYAPSWVEFSRLSVKTDPVPVPEN